MSHVHQNFRFLVIDWDHVLHESHGPTHWEMLGWSSNSWVMSHSNIPVTPLPSWMIKVMVSHWAAIKVTHFCIFHSKFLFYCVQWGVEAAETFFTWLEYYMLNVYYNVHCNHSRSLLGIHGTAHISEYVDSHDEASKFIFKLLYGMLPLEIETWRCIGTKAEHRYCIVCRLGAVEDEMYILYGCLALRDILSAFCQHYQCRCF